MIFPVTSSQRRLVILRHAKSDWTGDEPDVLRPLNKRGNRDAPAVGRWLRDHIGHLDVVVCSPATRTRQTWELAGAMLPDAPAAVLDERVYDASAGVLLGIVQELPDTAATVLLVGHNPGVQDLAVVLARERITMTTSTLAVLTWSGSWARAAAVAATLQAHQVVHG